MIANNAAGSLGWRTLWMGVALGVLVAACGDDGTSLALRGRRFLLQSSTGFEPVAGSTVNVRFTDEDEFSFGGGCNGHFGSYEISGDTFKLSQLGSTQVGCDEERHAQDAFLAAFFTGEPSVQLDGDTLTFASAEATLVFLDREVADPDRPLVGTLWTVDTFIMGGGASAFGNDAASPTLSFAEDGSLSAFTGCNTGGGNYTVDGSEITITGMAYTEEGCNDEASLMMEQHMQQLLSGMLQFEIEAARLTLSRSDGLGAAASADGDP